MFTAFDRASGQLTVSCDADDATVTVSDFLQFRLRFLQSV